MCVHDSFLIASVLNDRNDGGSQLASGKGPAGHILSIERYRYRTDFTGAVGMLF